mgnify:CR=1 FL=1
MLPGVGCFGESGVVVAILADFLHIDRLEEKSFFTVLLIASLSVLKDVTIFIHGDVFETFLIFCELLVVQEEILFFFLSFLRLLQEVDVVMRVIFLSKGFKFNVDIN